MSTPSPMARRVAPNTKRWATRYPAEQRRQHAQLVQANIARHREGSAHDQAVAAGHPSAYRGADPAPVVELYDRTTDPDRPVLPLLVACALDRVLTHCQAPGQYTRDQVIEAADVVRAHFRPDLDECDALGLPRPS